MTRVKGQRDDRALHAEADAVCQAARARTVFMTRAMRRYRSYARTGSAPKVFCAGHLPYPLPGPRLDYAAKMTRDNARPHVVGGGAGSTNTS
jgi:hypothetical protein